MAMTVEKRAVQGLTDAVIAELQRRGLIFSVSAAPLVVGPEYDEKACSAVAHGLGNNPLVASETFYGLLAKKGEVGALELAKKLNVDRTPTLAFVLTTPLKRVSTRLGLPWPFDTDEGADGRTLWRDRDGIAALMLNAIRVEKNRRGL
jgi:hypothetical protein